MVLWIWMLETQFFPVEFLRIITFFSKMTGSHVEPMPFVSSGSFEAHFFFFFRFLLRKLYCSSDTWTSIASKMFPHVTWSSADKLFGVEINVYASSSGLTSHVWFLTSLLDLSLLTRPPLLAHPHNKRCVLMPKVPELVLHLDGVCCLHVRKINWFCSMNFCWQLRLIPWGWAAPEWMSAGLWPSSLSL